MPVSDQRPPVDYVSPATQARERNHRFDRRVARIGRQLLVGVLLLFTLPFLPAPKGIWYFGQRPQWVLAIDSAGLTVGPMEAPVKVLGFVPLVALELVLISVPVVLAVRYVRWRCRARAAAP